MSKLTQIILRGDRASQPAATITPPGSLYYVTDEQVTERVADDGLTWEDYTDAGGGGGGGVAIAAGTQTATTNTVVFSNSNGITFGMSGSTRITASHNGLTTAMASDRGSDFVQATAVFNGTNASGTIASGAISVSVGNYITTAALSGDTTKYVQAWQLTGNTAGTTSSLQGTKIHFQGGNSLTVSGSSNTIVFSVGNYLTTAMASNRGSDFVQANAVFNGTNASGTIASNAISVSVAPPSAGSVNFSAGTTSGNLTAVTFADSNGVSFGLDGGTITATVRTNYLTTAMASNRGSDFVQANAVFHGTNATGTIASNAISVSVAPPSAGSVNFSAGTTSGNLTAVTFADSNGVSFGLDAGTITATVKTDYLTTAMASNRGSDFVQANAVFHGTNASGTIASNAISVSVGNYLTTAALSGDTSKYVQAWELTGNTAGTTSSLQGTKIYFQGGNSLTVSGSSNSIVFSVGNYLTTARGSTDAIGLNTAQSNVTWTVNSSGLSLDARGYAGTVTAATNATFTLNSNGLSLSVGAGGAESNQIVLTGNTAGNTTASGASIAWSGGNGVTLSGTNNSVVNISVSTYNTLAVTTVGTATTVYPVASANSVGTVTRWAAEDHRHAGIGGIGISTGNTSGTTGSVVGTYWLAGSNGVTVSQITSNNGSHTLNLVGPPHLSYVNLASQVGNTVTTSVGQSTSFIAPFVLPWNHSFDRMRVLASGSVAASSTQATTGGTSLSMSAITSHNLVFYSRGTGASSLSLQYVTSTQAVDQCLMTASAAANSTQHSVSLRFTLGNQSFTKDYSSSVTRQDWHTSHLTDLTGHKYLDLPMGLSLSPGQYWIAYGRSTTFATQANSISVATRMAVSHNSMMGVSLNTLGALGMLGGASNSSVGWYPGHGSFTTSGAAGTTSSVEMSAVSTLASNNLMYLQMMRIV